MATWTLRFTLFGLLGQLRAQDTAGEELVVAQLAADDECLGVADDACAIGALQRRALQRTLNAASNESLGDWPNVSLADGPCTPTSPLYSCWETRSCCNPSDGCFEHYPGLAYCMPSGTCVPGVHYNEPPWIPWTCSRLDLPPSDQGTCHAVSCGRNVATCYALNWKAEGKTFFDDFAFVTQDDTHGAVKYVERQEAFASGVIEATDTSAFIRLGPRAKNYKIESVNIHSKYTWTPGDNFLIAMKVNHVPFGCGVWPALWTMNSGTVWPEGSEFDILEWCNTVPTGATLHTGRKYPCFLDAAEANKCLSQVDNNGKWECTTDYFPPKGPAKMGCAVGRPLSFDGDYINQHPGVIAMEWTSTYIKVFQISEREIPADLLHDKPRPATWDRFVTSYYPFDKKNCPNRTKMMLPQEIVLNTQLCGDWAGGTWEKAGERCPYLTGYFSGSGRCKVDVWNTSVDCCTQWTMSPGFEATKQKAYWDISWLKIFTDPATPAPSPATTSSTYRHGGVLQCSEQYTNCQNTKCCKDPAMKCFEKNADWAGCRTNCTPGIFHDDPEAQRTPWSCVVLSTSR